MAGSWNRGGLLTATAALARQVLTNRWATRWFTEAGEKMRLSAGVQRRSGATAAEATWTMESAFPDEMRESIFETFQLQGGDAVTVTK